MSNCDEMKKNLEDVSALIVLDGPTEASEQSGDLLGVEQREQAVKEHFQLNWHCMEALKVVILKDFDCLVGHRCVGEDEEEHCSYLKYEAGDVYDHAGRDPVKRDAGSEQARSSVHRLNHCKGGGECTERV